MSTKFSDKNLAGIDLRDADLSNTDLEEANLTDANLTGANLKDTNLQYAKLLGASLFKADLKKANLSSANLTKANLIDASLEGANLSNANLKKADLIKANLSSANLTNADLRFTNLRDANLRYANLRDAYLIGANLEGANLSYADLTHVDLTSANLSNANLSYANLEGVNFNNANLEGATFIGADLEGANFNGAKLHKTNFNYSYFINTISAKGSKYNQSTIFPEDFIPEAVGMVFIQEEVKKEEVTEIAIRNENIITTQLLNNMTLVYNLDTGLGILRLSDNWKLYEGGENMLSSFIKAISFTLEIRDLNVSNIRSIVNTLYCGESVVHLEIRDFKSYMVFSQGEEYIPFVNPDRIIIIHRDEDDLDNVVRVSSALKEFLKLLTKEEQTGIVKKLVRDYVQDCTTNLEDGLEAFALELWARAKSPYWQYDDWKDKDFYANR